MNGLDAWKLLHGFVIFVYLFLSVERRSFTEEKSTIAQRIHLSSQTPMVVSIGFRLARWTLIHLSLPKGGTL